MGLIQYGAPVSNIEDLLLQFGDIAQIYIIPTTIFNKKNGVFVNLTINFLLFDMIINKTSY
jgi:hypothetical protein